MDKILRIGKNCGALLLATSTMALVAFGSVTTARADDVAQAKADIAAATAPSTKWDGPTSGPKAAKDKFVIYVSITMTNSGSAGSDAGAKEAAAAIGWKYQTIDGQGTESGNSAALEQAIALKPDGIILGALAANEFVPLIQKAAADGIKIVGWHVSGGPGKVPDSPEIFWNISTDPYTIAKTASEYAVADSNGKAQAIIMTDPQYPIVRMKVRGESEALQNCDGCQILAVENCPFTEISQRMPSLMNAMWHQYGDNIQYMLAHNDLFFDFAIPTLLTAGVDPSGSPRMISAGDGSEAAYQRIRDGKFQVATVPEPTNLHGWQAIDELNRAFSGQQPSGYITKVHLVTKDNIDADGGKDNKYDPDNGYRDQYKQIWGVK